MNMQLTNMQAREVLETCNPLGVIDCNGRVKLFSSPVACYEHVITELYKFAPRGWVDIPLFIQKVQRIRIADAKVYCKRFKYALIDWSGGEHYGVRGNLEERVKGVLITLLRRTGCDFSEDAFRKALWDVQMALTEQQHFNSESKFEYANIKFL